MISHSSIDVPRVRRRSSFIRGGDELLRGSRRGATAFVRLVLRHIKEECTFIHVPTAGIKELSISGVTHSPIGSDYVWASGFSRANSVQRKGPMTSQLRRSASRLVPSFNNITNKLPFATNIYPSVNSFAHQANLTTSPASPAPALLSVPSSISRARFNPHTPALLHNYYSSRQYSSIEEVRPSKWVIFFPLFSIFSLGDLPFFTCRLPHLLPSRRASSSSAISSMTRPRRRAVPSSAATPSTTFRN